MRKIILFALLFHANAVQNLDSQPKRGQELGHESARPANHVADMPPVVARIIIPDGIIRSRLTEALDLATNSEDHVQLQLPPDEIVCNRLSLDKRKIYGKQFCVSINEEGSVQLKPAPKKPRLT